MSFCMSEIIVCITKILIFWFLLVPESELTGGLSAVEQRLDVPDLVGSEGDTKTNQRKYHL